MTLIRISTATLPLALAAVLFAGGCSKNNAPQPSPQQQGTAQPNSAGQQAMNPGATQMPPPPPAQQSAAPQQGPPAPPPAPSVIPAGTRLLVTLGQTISSKTAQPGDRFEATVAAPVVVHGATLIRAGAPASGTVVDAKALGRFKGGAELALRLDTVRAEGRTYRVASSTIERAEKGKGKRTATMVGGGAGLGGLIGGLAGGGKGLLIGGLAGAGAGTAGSAFTGNKELVIPAETRLTFRLERNVALE